MEEKTNIVISNNENENKKKFHHFFWAAWAMQAIWNPERQMNTGFMYGMAPTIDKLYSDPEDIEKKKEAYRRSLQFFNITPQLASFVFGITSALEERVAKDRENFPVNMITSMKTSLMGPLSGIGDTFFQGIVRVIAMGIGVSIAKQGSILGPIIAMLISAAISIPITYYGGKFGYLKGQKLLANMSDDNLLERIMYGCNVLGLIVIGAMIASLVPVTTPLAYGEALKVQDILDSICPKILPLCITGIMFWRVKKGDRPMIVLFACLVAGIILNCFGIFA